MLTDAGQDIWAITYSIRTNTPYMMVISVFSGLSSV
jgi:hypothetical protein